MDARVRIADIADGPRPEATGSAIGWSPLSTAVPWISDGLMGLACLAMVAAVGLAALGGGRRGGAPSRRVVACLGVLLALCGSVQLAGVIAGPPGRVAAMPALAGAACWAAALTLVRRTDRPDPGERLDSRRATATRTGRWTEPDPSPSSPSARSDEVPSTARDPERPVAAPNRSEARVRELTGADARRNASLAVLGHELRDPLAPIRDALRVMERRRPDDPDHTWARDVVEHQLTQLKQLVDDLLEVSRVTGGEVRLEREAIDVATLVAFAVESSRPTIEAHHHRLAIALPPEPATIEADPHRMEHVLANLLNNAARYTEDGGRIRLAVAREGEDVVFRVRDNGVGIAPEMIGRVFDGSARVDQSLARSQGGLGLGLTLVRSLVELHGGSVEARSEGPGRGSEFLVRLPAMTKDRPSGISDAPHAPPAEAPARRPDPLAAAIEGPEGTPGPEGGAPGRRVLVVDDSDSSAQSMATILGLEGYQVRVASDGETALGLVRRFRPEAVLSDIGLPGIDGHELARRIRQDPGLSAGVRLLAALTGYAGPEARRRSREAGFDHHLVKPIDPEDILALLATLEWSEQPRALETS